MSTALDRSVSSPRRFTKGLAVFRGFLAWLTADQVDLATAKAFTFGTGAPNHTDLENSLYWRVDGGSWAASLYRNTDGGTTWESIGTGLTSAAVLTADNTWTGTQDISKTVTGTDELVNADLSINHATQVGVAVDAQAIQLTTARTGGYAAAFRAKTTSLAADNGALYAGLYCLAPTDGGGTAAHVGLYDAGNDYGAYFVDNVKLGLGTGAANAPDVTLGWDGTDLDLLAAADDSVFKIGNGTNSFDLWVYGNIATSYLLWDASASQLSLEGAARPKGLNATSPRFELSWVAGSRGLVAINNDVAYTADTLFEILGTNAVSASCTYYAEGGLTLTTAGADNDQVILAPHLDTALSPWTGVTWGSDKETVWECDLTSGSNITNAIIWAGLKLTNTSTTATDNDQVFFRYEDDVNGGEWQCVSSIGGADTETDSNVAVATSTRYHLKIVIASDRTAKFYINGALIHTTAALTNATDFKPYIGVQANGAGAAKHIHVHSQAISRNIG